MNEIKPVSTTWPLKKTERIKRDQTNPDGRRKKQQDEAEQKDINDHDSKIDEYA